MKTLTKIKDYFTPVFRRKRKEKHVDRSQLSVVPGTLDELESEIALLQDPAEKSREKRGKLLESMRLAHKTGLQFDKVSVLVLGASGVGKSSTINHFLDFNGDQAMELAAINNKKSETRDTGEYVLNMYSAEHGSKGLKLAFVDTPGFYDTSGSRQDACNLHSIQRFIKEKMNSCRPNIVLILIKSTDDRIDGRDSAFAKTLRCVRELNVVDQHSSNVVVAVTCSNNFGGKRVFAKNFAEKVETLERQVLLNLGVVAPVVSIENKPDDYDYRREGDFTVLPDGTKQVLNLYNALYRVLLANNDLLGQLMINCAYLRNVETINKGLSVQAKDADEESLSTDEEHLLDLLTNRNSLGSIVMETCSALFEDIKDREKRGHLAKFASELLKLDLITAEDLKFISTEGISLLLRNAGLCWETSTQFLTKLGVQAVCTDLSQKCIVGCGYDIFHDRACKPIFKTETLIEENGLQVPSNVKIRKLVDSQQALRYKAFNHVTDDNVTLMKKRLAYRNIYGDIDPDRFETLSVPGFNVKSASDEQIFSTLEEFRVCQVQLRDDARKSQELSDEFRADLNTLLNKLNGDEREKWCLDFFSKWGFFVVVEAFVGGSVATRPNECPLFKGGAESLRKEETYASQSKMIRWRNSLTMEPEFLTTQMSLTPIFELIQEVDINHRLALYDCWKNLLNRKSKQPVTTSSENEGKKRRTCKLEEQAVMFIRMKGLDSCEAEEVKQIVKRLSEAGLKETKALQWVSHESLPLMKITDNLSKVERDFLQSSGLSDRDPANLSASALVGRGFNVLSNVDVPYEIVQQTGCNNKYGIRVPDYAILSRESEDCVHESYYESNDSFVKDRLLKLGISKDVDFELFKFQAQAGFNKNYGGSASSEKYSALHEFRLFEVRIKDLHSLKASAHFTDSVQELPQRFDISDDANRRKFEAFFDKWGHYMITRAYGGGSYEVIISEASNKQNSSTDDRAKVSGTVKIFKGNIGGKKKDASDSTHVYKVSSTVWNGGASELQTQSTIEDADSLAEWKASLLRFPVVLNTEMFLEPISSMVAIVDRQKGDEVYNALEQLLTGGIKRRRREQEKEKEHAKTLQSMKDLAEEQQKLQATREQTVREVNYGALDAIKDVVTAPFKGIATAWKYTFG